MTKDHTRNRETWLNQMSAELAPTFEKVGAPIPDNVRLTVGFPSTGKRGKRIGECWADSASQDGTFEIIIHPGEDDSIRVAGILAHELIHAAVGLEAGHKGAFKRVALAIGLQGKMTATTEGPEFIALVQPFIDKLGPIPHAALGLGSKNSGPKKQGTRLIKCVCQCGYTTRIARKWIDAAGTPICPIEGHGPMKAILPED